MNRIYTKTGDNGSTSLLNGVRVPKNHIRVETYGTIDELNAHIALLETLTDDPQCKKELLKIEKELFVIQTHLAVDSTETCKFPLPDINLLNTNELEKSIDNMSSQIVPLRTFCLLGGHNAVAQCHIARTVCRRAERVLISLAEKEPVNSLILCYINRLSDYLFILARYFAQLLNVKEENVEQYDRNIAQNCRDNQ